MRAAWPDDAGLPFSFSSSDGVPGVQHALRRFAPSAGWTRHACFVVTSSSTRFPHASASTFLPVRAHVPFVPLPPPRLIFVGVTDRLLEFNEICKSDRPGMRMASTSGLLLPSAVRLPSARLAGQAILPWALPLAGLSDTLLCIGRARPRYRSPASGPPGGPIRLRRFLSAHGLGDDPSHHTPAS
jgi:hypothetical protein